MISIAKENKDQGVFFVTRLAICSGTVLQEQKSKRKQEESAGKNSKHKANQVRSEIKSESDSDSSTVGVVTRSLLSVSTSDQSTDAWLIDSGATCHICNNRELFVQYEVFEKPQEISVGDGYMLQAIGSGIIALTLELSDHKTRKCKLHDVLYIPELKYNLLRVSKLTDDEKHVSFCKNKCFVYKGEKLLAVATKTGSLYHLDCVLSTHQQINDVLQQRKTDGTGVLDI